MMSMKQYLVTTALTIALLFSTVPQFVTQTQKKQKKEPTNDKVAPKDKELPAAVSAKVDTSQLIYKGKQNITKGKQTITRLSFVPRDRSVYATISITCSSGRTFRVSTGNNRGSCTVELNEGAESVMGAECHDNAGNDGNAYCNVAAGGACQFSHGSGSCAQK